MGEAYKKIIACEENCAESMEISKMRQSRMMGGRLKNLIN